MKTYYMRQKLLLWTDLEFTVNMPFSVKADVSAVEGSIGYLAVYETLEEFHKAYPDEQPVFLTVHPSTLEAP